MPMQAPQWTDFLSCPICCNDFEATQRPPISLGCSHTICKSCLATLHRKQCPFDQTQIRTELDQLPINYAMLSLVTGFSAEHLRTHAAVDRRTGNGSSTTGGDVAAHRSASPSTQTTVNAALAEPGYQLARANMESLSGYLYGLVPSQVVAVGNKPVCLSRPLLRKLVTLINCQLVEEEGRGRALRTARSIGERAVTEMILLHQNPQQLSANLWAAVRARGCQFLGPAMQEEVLKLVLLALEDGSALSRKVLVMFVVQRLEPHFSQASKTSIGHVVQLLYRASCFKVSKRDGDSSLMQLKEEFRTYETLRREHDAQIVQIATEAGLRIAPDQWSSLLYGDTHHKSHMQSIIDKLQTPQSFGQSVQELMIAIQRTNEAGRFASLRTHFKRLTAIDAGPEGVAADWREMAASLEAVRSVLEGLGQFMARHGNRKVQEPSLTVHNPKFKVSMCRDLAIRSTCPRGLNCTFAHSEEELDKYRAKNRKSINRTPPPSALGTLSQVEHFHDSRDDLFSTADSDEGVGGSGSAVVETTSTGGNNANSVATLSSPETLVTTTTTANNKNGAFYSQRRSDYADNFDGNRHRLKPGSNAAGHKTPTMPTNGGSNASMIMSDPLSTPANTMGNNRNDRNGAFFMHRRPDHSSNYDSYRHRLKPSNNATNHKTSANPNMPSNGANNSSLRSPSMSRIGSSQQPPPTNPTTNAAYAAMLNASAPPIGYGGGGGAVRNSFGKFNEFSTPPKSMQIPSNINNNAMSPDDWHASQHLANTSNNNTNIGGNMLHHGRDPMLHHSQHIQPKPSHLQPPFHQHPMHHKSSDHLHMPITNNNGLAPKIGGQQQQMHNKQADIMRDLRNKLPMATVAGLGQYGGKMTNNHSNNHQNHINHINNLNTINSNANANQQHMLAQLQSTFGPQQQSNYWNANASNSSSSSTSSVGTTNTHGGHYNQQQHNHHYQPGGQHQQQHQSAASQYGTGGGAGQLDGSGARDMFVRSDSILDDDWTVPFDVPQTSSRFGPISRQSAPANVILSDDKNPLSVWLNNYQMQQQQQQHHQQQQLQQQSACAAPTENGYGSTGSDARQSMLSDTYAPMMSFDLFESGVALLDLAGVPSKVSARGLTPPQHPSNTNPAASFVGQQLPTTSSPKFDASDATTPAWHSRHSTSNANSNHSQNTGTDGSLFRSDDSAPMIQWQRSDPLQSLQNTTATSSASSLSPLDHLRGGGGGSGGSQRDLYEFGIDSGMRELERRLQSDLEEQEKQWEASTAGAANPTTRVHALTHQQQQQKQQLLLPQPSSVRH